MQAHQVKTHFADVLDRVEHRGETITVTRRGKPIAEIGPPPVADVENGGDPFVQHLLAMPKGEGFEPMPRSDDSFEPAEL
jgi:prevent-host-death family protein